MEYVSPSKASKFYNVCTNTLRDWADQGKIEFTKTDIGDIKF